MKDYYMIGALVVGGIFLYGFLRQFKQDIIEDREHRNKPIVDLLVAITELRTAIDGLRTNEQIVQQRLTKHGDEIDETKANLIHVNHELKEHDERIAKLEGGNKK